jgi:hypothetical protein
MRSARYCWRSTSALTVGPAIVTVVLCAILGAVALGSFAAARRTETAYGRYLHAVHASDALVNIPAPNTSLIAMIERLPGIRASAAYLGFDANPVVHGRVDPSFVTNGVSGSIDGELFRQDAMTVLSGRLPPLNSTNQIVLTPSIAHLFGVGVGGHVRYQFQDNLSFRPRPTGVATYRVAAIAQLPPVLVDQFDQASSAVLPPGASAAAERRLHSVVYSWVGVRLVRGASGIPALQGELRRLVGSLGGGFQFPLRQLDTVHQQVQEAIEPQAVAVALFGALALLALLVLVAQALSLLLERTHATARVLSAVGATRIEAAASCGLVGAVAVLVGMALAIGGAVALSPLAPIGTVRQVDPVRGAQLDGPIVLGGALVITVVLLATVAWLAWHAVAVTRRADVSGGPTFVTRVLRSMRLPLPMSLGATYAMDPPAGGRRTSTRASVVGGIVAVTAVVTATVFGASLHGLVTHPDRYGWRWQVLIQDQGGYGDFLPASTTFATLGDGDGSVDRLLGSLPEVSGWSTFGFSQVPINGQVVPVLALTTHRGDVAPPTVSGKPLTDTGPVDLSNTLVRAPDEIELGATTLRQLGVSIGQHVEVGTGAAARRCTVVGVVTLPSIGVQDSDHVSLGRGAMLPEPTLLAVEGLYAFASKQDQAFSALPSTIALDLAPGADAQRVVARIVAAEPGSQPGDIYRVPRVLGAAIVNAGQMGSQPLALATALAVAMVVSIAGSVLLAARRRRRDLAVLKALGFTGAQLRQVVVVQATTFLLIAILVGTPVGLAAGAWAWTRFATSIGVVPVVEVPVLVGAAGLVLLLAVGLTLAALPGRVAARTPTTYALRAE